MTFDLCELKVIHEVEERRQKIEKLEAELVSLEALCEQYNTNLEQLHNAWINPIKELLEKINSSFRFRSAVI